ncbi:MAG: FG-GAP-like repeat-containing protein [Deinococcales bacterium]
MSADDFLSTDVALGEVNEDGYLDAIFANDGESNRLCMGSASGIFSCADVSTDTNNSLGVDLADVDGDGKAY